MLAEKGLQFHMLTSAQSMETTAYFVKNVLLLWWQQPVCFFTLLIMDATYQATVSNVLCVISSISERTLQDMVLSHKQLGFCLQFYLLQELLCLRLWTRLHGFQPVGTFSVLFLVLLDNVLHKGVLSNKPCEPISSVTMLTKASVILMDAGLPSVNSLFLFLAIVERKRNDP